MFGLQLLGGRILVCELATRTPPGTKSLCPTTPTRLPSEVAITGSGVSGSRIPDAGVAG